MVAVVVMMVIVIQGAATCCYNNSEMVGMLVMQRLANRARFIKIRCDRTFETVMEVLKVLDSY